MRSSSFPLPPVHRCREHRSKKIPSTDPPVFPRWRPKARFDKSHNQNTPFKSDLYSVLSFHDFSQKKSIRFIIPCRLRLSLRFLPARPHLPSEEQVAVCSSKSQILKTSALEVLPVSLMRRSKLIQQLSGPSRI